MKVLWREEFGGEEFKKVVHSFQIDEIPSPYGSLFFCTLTSMS
jgi:hypothetical protein